VLACLYLKVLPSFSITLKPKVIAELDLKLDMKGVYVGVVVVLHYGPAVSFA
jgi:hypothetical protein